MRSSNLNKTTIYRNNSTTDAPFHLAVTYVNGRVFMGLPLKELVSKNVRMTRKRLGISQAALASRSGLSVRYLSKVENDPMEITLHNLERIANGLEITVSELVQDQSIGAPKVNKKNQEAIAYTVRLLESLLERKG